MTKEQEMVAWVQDCITCLNAVNGKDYNDGISYVCNEFLARFAPKPMTFMEAVEAMKQGKKVGREAWVGFENLNVRFEGNCVRWYDNKGLRNDCVFEVSDFFIADWILYEEGV